MAGRGGGVITCDCASVPPTMPTCRSEHLPSCPIAVYQRRQVEVYEAFWRTEMDRRRKEGRRRAEPHVKAVFERAIAEIRAEARP